MMDSPPDTFYDPPEPRLDICPLCDGEGDIGTVENGTLIWTSAEPPVFVSKDTAPLECPRCHGTGEVILTKEELDAIRDAAIDAED